MSLFSRKEWTLYVNLRRQARIDYKNYIKFYLLDKEGIFKHFPTCVCGKQIGLEYLTEPDPSRIK